MCEHEVLAAGRDLPEKRILAAGEPGVPGPPGAGGPGETVGYRQAWWSWMFPPSTESPAV